MRRAVALLLIGAVERLLFTRVAAIPRRLVRRALADTLDRVAREFDAPLYLRQMRNSLRRRRAARDPALHYALLGWREHRAPNARFDPKYYRLASPSLASPVEPFAHYLRFGRAAGAAQNEPESARRRYPATTPTRYALVLHHGRGGGSSRFLALYEARLVAQGVFPLRLRMLSNGAPSLMVCEDAAGATHIFDIFADRAALVDFAREVGVTQILVNHVIDLPAGIFTWIVDLSRDIGAPFDMILHDYFMLCPRVTLVDFRGRYCGVASDAACLTCLKASGGDLARVDISAWRSQAMAFLGAAREVIVPSGDLRQRLAPYFSGPVRVWVPDGDGAPPPVRPRPIASGAPFRIVIIGGLSAAKGGDVVLGLARAIAAARAPIELHLAGSSDQDRRLRAAGVAITGRYRESDLRALLDAIGPHAAFIPSIWPETWSFVLSHALAEGLPTVVFDIGAPAARLRALNRADFIAPLALANKSDELMEYFLRLKARLAGKEASNAH